MNSFLSLSVGANASVNAPSAIARVKAPFLLLLVLVHLCESWVGKL